MISAARFVPMFGVAPHIPNLCTSGERDGNPDDATDPRLGEQPKPRRKSKRRRTETGPCGTCGGRIPVGSVFVCSSCHAVAPDVAARVARHALPALEFDRRYGDGREKQRAKAEADAKAARRKAARLTKKEQKALLRDARAGEHPIPVVREFLAAQAG